MKRWVGPVAVFVALAGISHWAVLSRAPSTIMSVALDRLAERGVPTHAFALSPASTPQTQTIVRPAPDLSYSVCLFDFAALDGPLRVGMSPYTDYASLSFFDSDTNNFLTIRGEGQAQEILLAPPGSASADNTVISPTERGLILIRRLSPNAAARGQVEQAARGDICAPV